jgi:hypothetical protein
MYWAVIKDNLVINTIVWDGVSKWSPPENCEVVPLTGEAGIGYRYENGEFIEPISENPSPPTP